MNSDRRSSAARRLGRAALLGTATGMRSTAGLAVVAMRVRRGILGHRAARPLAATAVAVELVLDKMPFTGSRLRPEGLVGRVIFAGLAAVVCTLEEGAPTRDFVGPVAVAVGAALGSAKLAHDLRARLAAKYPDPAIAAVEDVAALSVAALAISI